MKTKDQKKTRAHENMFSNMHKIKYASSII